MKNIVTAISGSGLLITGAILFQSISGKGAIIALGSMILGAVLLLFANISDDNNKKKPPSNEENNE